RFSSQSVTFRTTSMPTTTRWLPPSFAFRPLPTCLTPSSWNRTSSSNSIRDNGYGLASRALPKVYEKAASARRGFFHSATRTVERFRRGHRCLLCAFAHAVPGVEPGNLVGFRKRRIVEGVLDKVVHGSLEVEHRLADVDKLGCPFTDDMDAEQAAGLAREDHLQEARLEPHDVTARCFAEMRDT